MRAAASSIASGSPSSRAQIAATAAGFAAVRAKAGLAARARVTKSWTASGTGKGCDGDVVLVRHPQHDPAGGEDLQPRAAGQQVGDRGAASTTCSRLSRTSNVWREAQVRHELFGQRAVPVAQPERRWRSSAARVPDRGAPPSSTKQTPSANVRRDLGGDLQREAGLADPAGAGQGDERDIVAAQQVTDGRDVVLAADERGARKREPPRPWVGGRRSGHRGTRIAGRTKNAVSATYNTIYPVPWWGR